jgi:peptidoglycan/LPS O-acetylase OafA/YrhL
MNKNNLDLLRLYASFQVLLQHSTYYIYNQKDGIIHYINKLLQYLHGVPIFFLISGFLIAISYERSNDIKNYIFNRVLRIYPALYVNLIFTLIVLSIFGVLEWNFELFSWILAQMSIFQFYNIDMFRDFGIGVINGSLWTISVELVFYIILPILIFLYRKKRVVLYLLFIGSFLSWNYLYLFETETLIDKLLRVSILPHLFIFIIGILFYKNFDMLKKYIEDKFLIWFAIYLLFSYLYYCLGFETFIFFRFIRWIIIAFLVFSFAFSFRGLSDKLLHGNDYTYGIYIYHAVIVNIFVQLNLVGRVEYLISVILLSILFGILSWHFIEKPILKFKKYSIRKYII